MQTQVCPKRCSRVTCCGLYQFVYQVMSCDTDDPNNRLLGRYSSTVGWCIFWPAFGCWGLQMLFELFFINIFLCKKAEKRKKKQEKWGNNLAPSKEVFQVCTQSQGLKTLKKHITTWVWSAQHPKCWSKYTTIGLIQKWTRQVCNLFQGLRNREGGLN